MEGDLTKQSSHSLGECSVWNSRAIHEDCLLRFKVSLTSGLYPLLIGGKLLMFYKSY